MDSYVLPKRSASEERLPTIPDDLDQRPYWFRASTTFTSKSLANLKAKQKEESEVFLPLVEKIGFFPDLGDTVFDGAKEKERERARNAYHYQQLPDLVSRLTFVAVSGEDPSYIDAFLLTYRRFATPRAVLLRLQLCLRELSQITTNDNIDDFARLRICFLLESWINTYPNDFYAPGTKGALKALHKTITNTPGLLHYASDLRHFVHDICEGGNNRDKDLERDWALEETDPVVLENESIDGLDAPPVDLSLDTDPETEPEPEPEVDPTPPAHFTQADEKDLPPPSPPPTADSLRKNSVSSTTTHLAAPNTPIASAYSYSHSPSSSTSSGPPPPYEPAQPRKLSSASQSLSTIPEPELVPFPVITPPSQATPLLASTVPRRSTRSSSTASQPQTLKFLSYLLPQVLHAQPLEIAQQITKIQIELFMKIEPRDWIRHILVKPSEFSENCGLDEYGSMAGRGKVKESRRNKKVPREHVRAFNNFYNHLGAWTTSLVLTHSVQNMKGRVRTLTHFIRIARELRLMHNYSGLRAVLSGIMNATYEGDQMMEMLKDESTRDLWKSLGSYSVLMSSAKGHAHYRMAVGNVVGGVIPEAEIHTSDLQRLWSIQPDFHRDDPTRVNWGKFSNVGKIIAELSACQKRCRRSAENGRLRFEERRHIRKWIFETDVMDEELLRTRIPPPELLDQSPDGYTPGAGGSGSSSPPQGGLKRLASIFS